MDKSERKPIIGILGGIGSGKSTVAREFGKLGCAVIDADKIGHELLETEDVKAEVVGLFGEAIVGPTGKIDRKKLGGIVFSEVERLSSLNRVIHPRLLGRVEQLIKQYQGQSQVKAIVLDMPLLVEVGWAKRCDRLVFVACERRLRAERAKKIGVFDENQLKIMENFQISLDKKADMTENTVDNNAGFSDLARQVAKIFSYITDTG